MGERRAAHELVILNALASELVFALREQGQELFEREVFQRGLFALEGQLGEAELAQVPVPEISRIPPSG